MIKIFSIALITIGSYLEIQFYIWRFEQEGLALWLCAIIGIALTLFLSIAVLNRDKAKIKILILCLIIYSVLATSAGQSFSLSQKQNIDIEQEVHEIYIQEDIDDIELQIQRLDNKYDQIQKGIEETAQTLHDRGLYRTAIQTAEKEQENIYTEREKLRTELTELKANAITHEEIEQHKTGIYQFYEELTGNTIPEKWIQFIFQTILSIFIAIMAPLGIITIQTLKKEPEKKEENKPNRWNKLIEKWVQINWMGIRTGQSNRILAKKAFLTYINKKSNIMTDKEYNYIYKLALKTGCINKTNVIQKNEQESANAIIGVLNDK